MQNSPHTEHKLLHFPEHRIAMPAKPLTRLWMLVGTSALAIPGLFAIVLVIARGGSFSDMPVFANMFTKALVVHVDLLVLVWFLSMAYMLWSLLVSASKPLIPYLEEFAVMCVAGGMIAITLSAFDPHGQALKSNYIPVIVSPLFFVGLSLFLSGSLLMLVRLLTADHYTPFFDKPQQYGLFTSGIIGCMAVVAFIWANMLMPKIIIGEQYYDMSFWGGGHILQFIHTQCVMVCWLLLARALKHEFMLSAKLQYTLFSIGLVAALITPAAYIMFDIFSMQHRQFFTMEMIIAGSAAPIVLSALLLPVMWGGRSERFGENRALWSCLVMSVILFLFGGLIGSAIRDENVVVPAHYHGSIVGITLAFMGAVYLILPILGYKNMSSTRLAYWQPIVCGIGQIMHVSGLAWSGGYGVLRKTPGGLEHAPLSVKIAMGVMEWGGLLAVIGGVMFIMVVWKSVRGKPRMEAKGSPTNESSAARLH